MLLMVSGLETKDEKGYKFSTRIYYDLEYGGKYYAHDRNGC